MSDKLYAEETIPISEVNLVFDKDSLGRLVGETPQDGQESLENGIKAAKWAHDVLVNEPQTIEAFGIATSGKRIRQIEIQLSKKEGEEEGEVIIVPAHIMERAFGLRHFQDANGNEGFLIGEQPITPKTGEAEIERALERARFEGVKFGGDRAVEDAGVYIWKGSIKLPTKK
jgi:hypothetical protein